MSSLALFKERRWLVLVTALAVIAGGAWLYDRYRFTVLWPAQVQQKTVGAALVDSGALISKERDFSGYGEGFARWRYRVTDPSPALRSLCEGAELSRCSFVRHRRVQEGVRVTVRLSGGVLTVEEWWS
jgi:hypothetical protein